MKFSTLTRVIRYHSLVKSVISEWLPSKLCNLTKTQVWFELTNNFKLNHCDGNAELKRFELNVDLYLRPATENDVPELWKMLNELATAENDTNNNTFEKFNSDFCAGKFQCILAIVNDEIAGYVVFLGKIRIDNNTI